MKKLFIIGGGEIGRPGTPIETTKLDKEMLKLTGKKKPRLLFLPTASGDSESYYDVVKQHFGKRIGFTTDVLYLIKDKPNKKEVEKKIFSADVIYVGGGDTLKMLRVWKKTGVDDVLKKAYEHGVILSGLSAGSICWFKGGPSDTRTFKNPKANPIKITCLGWLPAIHSPHYDVEKDRRPAIKKIMKRTPGVAIGIDNCCALIIINDKYKVIATKPTANTYKAYWKAGKFFEVKIKKTKDYRPISELFSK